MAAVSAQAGCQLLSTSFRKESTSGCGSSGDLLESSSQSFLGSPRSVARLRGAGGVPRQTSRSSAETSASLFSMTPGNFMASMIPSNFMANVQEDDVKKNLEAGEGEDENVLESSNEFLDTINNVLADVVDGQKFLKETGRTKPRPMKRRSLVVCFAMGAIQPYLNEVEDRVGSLRRTASSSFAKTLRLASQLSVGASKAIESIAEEYRKQEAERQAVPEVETTLGNLRRTTSTSLARAKSLVSQLSIGASRAVNYIAEELRIPEEGDQQLIPAAA
ncbi:hypothetical protein M758_4G211900 [Ceratodon purpureus]|nr:hypothetical protein M758_4G211900 [Ceratodon purpureus]